jgi:hypothetical protein
MPVGRAGLAAAGAARVRGASAVARIGTCESRDELKYVVHADDRIPVGSGVVLARVRTGGYEALAQDLGHSRGNLPGVPSTNPLEFTDVKGIA